jgi:hypothetical protein
MKYYALSIILALPFTIADSNCDASNAISIWDSVGSDTDFSGDFSTDDFSFTKRAAVPVSPYFHKTTARHIAARRRLNNFGSNQKRQSDSLTCTGNQVCFIDNTDGLLFCVDGSTGEFTDSEGDSGNANTGEITMADGSSTTLDGFALGTDSGDTFTDIGSSFSAAPTEGSSPSQNTDAATTDSGSGVPAPTSGNGAPDVTSTAGDSGSSPSVSGGSQNGQPTGHVAGGAAGRAVIDVAAAVGAFGLMAVAL